MKGKRLRSLSGTVLVMILTVMLVLIIMLMATLTVVSTASQRIYTKYEENQAYYTARSALDVYVEKLLYDGDGYALKNDGTYWEYVYSDADGNSKQSTSHMKQGLALQLDLYNLKSLNRDASGNPLTNYGIMENADNTIFYTSSGYRDFVSTTKESITYQVKMPAATNNSTNGSMVSDNIIAKDSKSYNDVQLKIQVLDRKYKLGGPNADTFEAAIAANESNFLNAIMTSSGAPAADTAVVTGSLTVADLKEAIRLGDRQKDTIRLKVTATATFRDVEQTSVLVFDVSEPPVINGTRAITAFGSANNIDNMTVVGGVSIPDETTANNVGSITGNVYIKGDFDNGDGGTEYELIDSECFFIEGGNCTWTNSFNIKGYNSKSPTDSEYRNNRPFLFVDGSYGGQNASAGAPGNEVDLLAKEISGLSNAFTHYGDIYVDGDVDFTGVGAHNPIIDGDLYVSGTATFYEKINGDGSVTTYYPMKPDGTTPVSVYTGASVSFEDNDEESTDKIDIVLPNGVKKTLPTEGSIYSEHHKDGDISQPLFTAEELAFLTKEQRLNGETTTKTFASEAGTVSEANSWAVVNNRMVYGKTVVASWGSYFQETGSVSTTLDSDLGSVYNMTAGSYKLAPLSTTPNGKILVSGGGIVDLYLTQGTYQNNLCIIVDDDTTLRVFGDTPGGIYNMHNVTIANRTIYNAIEDGSNIYVGQTGTGMVSPTVSMYFDAGSTINMENTLVTAYIQSPGATVEIDQPQTIDNVVYNNVAIGSKNLTVIGSILCDVLTCNNMAGVAYINPNVPTTAEGEPILSFKSIQYRRN
ncbi:MAG: hypothetical protein K2J73_03025 [Oscillospiraceae bacterium]|nr:hypothetical protein [Oscillospiraceae bacterium]